MKRVINIKEVGENLIEIKLEATKRKKIWLVLRKGATEYCCSDYCPLYRFCTDLPSPLLKYPNFGEFCNQLFNEYPELPLRLATEYGVTNINQVVPVFKK